MPFFITTYFNIYFMKRIHIINLLSVINVKYKIEIFNKNKPYKILLKLPFSDYELLKSGWQKYHKQIFYNGNKFWLHPNIMTKLKITSNDLSQIGLRISNNEQKKYKINTSILKLIPRNEQIVFIVEESNLFSIKNYIIDEIENELKNKGYNIFQFKTLQEYYEKGLITAQVLLEYLTGHKIKNDKFIETPVTQFNKVNYYDSDPDILNYMSNLDELLKKYYDSSDKDIKTDIYSDLKYSESNYYLTLYQILPNKKNLVKKESIKLGILDKFNYLESFSSFNS